MRDAEVGQPPAGAEHVVEVEHRLAHAHEDGVREGPLPAEMERLVDDLPDAVRLRRKRIWPVAQNVQVSGQPDCEERQSERRPSR